MSGAPLRVTFLTLDPTAASARVRVSDHLPGLAALGVEGALVALPRGHLARRRLFRALAPHDVVVSHRLLFGELDLAPLRRHARALVLDVDDAVDRRPVRGRRSRRLERRLALMLAAADLVVCGSVHLRDALRARHPRVRLVPPASPPGEPPRATSHEEGPVRLVWTGSRSTLPYLEGLGPALADVALARPGRVVLEVLADARPTLAPAVPVEFTPWSRAAEEAALRRAAIGLYPLDADPWSEGKCGYKLRRYMAFGLPSVASPGGGGREALAPDEGAPGGLLAEDREGWRDALLALIDDPALRARLGRQALGLALGRGALPDRTRSLARILREAAAVGVHRLA